MDIFSENILKVNRDQKGQSLISFPSSYTIIDLETTGLSPSFDHIIEVAGVKVQNNQIVDTFSSLVGNGGHIFIDSFITDLTGITQSMVDNAPHISTVLPAYLDFVSDDVIVGHNVNFDINFIYDNSESPFRNNFVDTMRISRRLHPEISHHRLPDLCVRYGVDYSNAHRALGDCKCTFSCYNSLQTDILETHGSFDAFIDFCRISSRGVRASDITSTVDSFDKSHPLYGKECVFTGKLERMTRKEAMQIVVNYGGVNRDTVTQNTNFLVLGNNDYCTSIKGGKSSKQKKAEKLKLSGFDIEIIPENIFYDMISD